MNSVKILLIEDNQMECQAFLNAVTKFPQLEFNAITDSARNGLHLLRQKKFDVVILDLELAEGNGVELLFTMEELEQHPYVVITTNTTDPVTLQMLRNNGAGFIFVKTIFGYSPRQVLQLVERASQFVHCTPITGTSQLPFNLPGSGMDDALEKRIGMDLSAFGFSAALKGYRYLIDAIMLVLRSDEILSITKEVYPTVGSKYKAEPYNVERSIRHAIQTTWDRTIEDDRRIYVNIPTDPGRGYPSNSTFIYSFAQRYR